MKNIHFHKVVDEIPNPPQANAMYFVKVGEGFDVYVTGTDDGMGNIDVRILNQSEMASTFGDSETMTMSQKAITTLVESLRVDIGNWDGEWGDLSSDPTKVDKEPGKTLISEMDLLKLVSIEHGATRNHSDDYLLNRENHIGDIGEIPQLEEAITQGLLGKVDIVEGKGLVADEVLDRLATIETGATKNMTDANLLDRAYHTGLQPITSIIGLQPRLNDKVDKESGKTLISAEDITKLNSISVLDSVVAGNQLKPDQVALLKTGAVSGVTHWYDQATRNVYYTEDAAVGTVTGITLGGSSPYVTVSGKKHDLLPIAWKAWRENGDLRGWGAKCDYRLPNGDKNPYPTDDTEALVRAISYMNQKKNVDKPHILRVQGGVYIATPNRLFNTFAQNAVRVRIVGDHYRVSELVYSVPNSVEDEYMINVDDTRGDNTTFAFCSFENLAIKSENDNGYFMRMKTNGSSQLIKFIDCQIWQFGRFIDAEGITNGSEFEFRSCRIRNFTAPESEYIIKMANPQALNWMFMQTHIEVFDVPMFRMIGGGSISMFGGSIIPTSGGSIIDIPPEANDAHFGPGNRPTIQFKATRFELRGESMLITKRHHPDIRVASEFLFDGCNMGGSNMYPDSHTPIDYVGGGHMKFVDCSNMANYKMKYRASGAQSHNPTFTFIRSDLPSGFITESDVVITSNNVRTGPKITIDNGDNSFPTGIFNFSGAFVGYNKTTYYSSSIHDSITRTLGGELRERRVRLVPSSVRQIEITVGELKGFGNILLSVTVYNHDRSKNLGRLEWNAIDDIGKNLTLDMYHQIEAGEDLVLDFTNSSSATTANVYYNGIMTIHH